MTRAGRRAVWTTDWRRVGAFAILLTILVGAAAIRLVGIDWGRPFAYHPDEWIVLKPAMTMIHERDWNPHVFWYPSLLIDLQAGLLAAMRQFGGPSLETNQPWMFQPDLLSYQFGYLLGGRLLVLALGLATVAVVFVVGTQLRGRLVGLLAAVLLATAPLHISDSRFLTTDVPTAFFCAVTLAVTLRAAADRRDRWWVLAGIAAGLAIATKWNGALVLGVPLMAYLLSASSLREALGLFRRRTPYLIVGSALLVVLVTTPGIVLDTTTVVQYLQQQAAIYRVERPRIASDSLIFNLRGLAAGMGPAIVVATLGVARLLFRPRRAVELTLPAFVLGTLVVLSIPPRQYDRNMIPMLPYLAVAAACLLGDLPEIARGVGRRWTRHEPRSGIGVAAGVVGAIVVLVAVAQGAGAGVASGEAAARPDTRTIAREWILANVPRKTVIARERDTPFLTPDEYLLRPFRYLTFHTLDWYRRADTQLMVTSSYAYGAFIDNPATPQPASWYRELFALPEVFRIEPGPDRPGPTIRIYRLAPVQRGSTGESP